MTTPDSPSPIPPSPGPTPDPASAGPTPGAPEAPKSNKKMFMLLGGGAGIAFVLLLCVCSGVIGGYFLLRGSGNIVGKWKDNETGFMMEFKSDKTYTITTPLGVVEGTYEADGKKLTTTTYGVKETEDYSISGSTLTLSQGNVSRKFTRQ